LQGRSQLLVGGHFRSQGIHRTFRQGLSPFAVDIPEPVARLCRLLLRLGNQLLIRFALAARFNFTVSSAM
jgi:hypothetical protein